MRLLGELPIDIHAGGVDLIFPHHENEIAQTEGATKQQFSRFWVHVEHLMIETRDRAGKTEKMSKSLGNVYNLEDIVAQGFRPSALRYLYLGVHYRKQLKFSWAPMAQAEEALKRLTDFLARLDTLPARPRQRRRSPTRLQEARDGVRRAHPRRPQHRRRRSASMFDLVRALNSAIDAGELQRRRRARPCARRSSASIACSASCRCAAPKTSIRRCRSRRSSS